MQKIARIALAGIASWTMISPALAEEEQEPAAEEHASTANVIIVQARRRDEVIQDVPVSMQAVTSQDLGKLNIRDFQDVQTLVPGLNLAQDANGIGSRATLRGIAYNVNASGNNGTVEFYLNDAPLSAGILFQSMFDVGQIEVLRGPQGTLRGRASPSGSITVTTHKPDLGEAGGYMTGTVNNVGGVNVNGAINIPIVADMLGIRIAGIIDENDDNEVRSINSPLKPYRNTQGIRASVAAEPFDALSLFASYTSTDRKVRTFDQVESVNIADPDAPASLITIEASDLLSVEPSPRLLRQQFKVYNWQAELRLLGQKLNYVGSYSKQRYDSREVDNKGGYYGPEFSEEVTAAGLTTISKAKQKTHEIRISNEERVAGIFDYVAGALFNELNSPAYLTSDTLVWLGTPQPDESNLLVAIATPITRLAMTKERSFFGNLTAHIGDSTEISGGIRRIRYQTKASLEIAGTPVAAADDDTTQHATIYQASLKHRFNTNVLAYASFGTSWRPGSSTNPIIQRNNIAPTPEQAALLFPGAEKSKSYELGIKTDWMNNRLRFNLSAYHQTFKNFGYFSTNIFIAEMTANGPQSELLTGVATGVPAKVDGIEAELNFQVTPDWSIGTVISYAKSKVRNGSVPCNDFFPADGVPDSSSNAPSYDDIMTATDGAGIALCQVSSRAGTNAPWSATLQSEYNLPVSSSADGYLRGLVVYNGKSLNDPNNTVDNIDAYAVVNLFAGLRGTDGSWDVGVYAKNLFDVERVLTRNSAAYAQTIRMPGATNQVSTYRGVTYTPAREVGVTARFTFGSR